MKKFFFSATTAAVLAALSAGASAAVDLDTGKTPAKYASELVVVGSTALKGAVADVSSTIDFGVSTGQTRFIRYDLTNAKFKGTVALGDLSVTGGTPPIVLGPDIIVVQGGLPDSTFVVFQITAKDAIGQDATVAFKAASGASGGLVMTTAGAVQMAYSLYADPALAAAGGASGRLNTNFAAQTIASLASGLSFTTVQNTTIVDVAAATPYTRFILGVGGTSTTVAQIGTVSADAAAGVNDPTGAAVTYGQLVDTGTALVLKGDFGAAAAPSTAGTGVYLGVDGGNCGTPGTAPTPATPVASAKFTTNAVPVVNRPLCFSLVAANTIQIPTQSFTVELDVTAKAGSTTADAAPIGAGAFNRNGLVLKTAFAETTTASGVSSTISLTNTTPNVAPFKVRCILNSGAVDGTPGSLPANTAQRFSLTSGLGCPSTGTLRGVELTFAVTPGSVIGSVVRQNTSTGAASFDNMVGNQ